MIAWQQASAHTYTCAAGYTDGNLAAQLGAARRWVGPAIFMAQLAPVHERHRGARRNRARDVALAPRRARNVVKTMVSHTLVGVV